MVFPCGCRCLANACTAPCVTSSAPRLASFPNASAAGCIGKLDFGDRRSSKAFSISGNNEDLAFMCSGTLSSSSKPPGSKTALAKASGFKLSKSKRHKVQVTALLTAPSKSSELIL
eukprot:CAMPEP_0115734198 /NCGR_PEP_ID=MMETSP0272-20121206/86062_1 /TAXON_ID=71861 /ORGANISM="Scrippsiella trochoidea, Strain CCMP3099" /LENGTH=115 /DNA_ID=CAMNT_0003178229 /DNA_START=26 /DNA_END=369 /DNA_ORIENTATION=-